MANGLTYAQRLQIARDTELQIGVDTGFQKAADFFGIALYEEGFGEKSLEKIARRVMELDEEYGDAWTGLQAGANRPGSEKGIRKELHAVL